MSKNIRISLTLVGAVFLAGLATALGTQRAFAFDKDLLLSDSVMDNKSIMSAAQIDQFLNSYNNSCISTESGFQSVKPTGYNPDDGFLYGSFTSAGGVIYAAAQAYDINPQVLLVTLQKEQSLVTGGSGICTTNRIAKAMGFGCPDSGHSYDYTGVSIYRRNGTTYTSVNDTCVNVKSKVGFSQQIIRAAWMLKFTQQRSQGRVEWAIIKDGWDNSDDPESCYSGRMIKGTWRRCPSGSYTFYDGLESIDGETVRMGSGATAALYGYTPHFHGNENFVAIFEDWFGSIVGTPFFKVPNDNKTYVLGADDLYYHVPSQEILEAYGYGKYFTKVAALPTSQLTGKTFAGLLPLVARFEDDAIYLVDRGGAYHFQSGTMMNEYGYLMGDEAELPASLGFYFPDSGNVRTIIREYGGDRVFLMDNGERRRFVDGDALKTGSPAYNTLPYVRLSSTFMSSLPATFPILGDNKLIKTYDNGGYAFWNGEMYFNISRDTVINLGLTQDYDLDSSEVSNLTRAAAPVQVTAESHGKYYLLDKKRKLEIPSSQLTLYGLDASDFTSTPSNMLNRVGTTSMTQLISIDGGNAKYLLSGGQRSHFDSSAAISEQGLSTSNLRSILSRTATVFPDSGKLVLETGTLFKVNGQPQTYLINGVASKLHIPSPTMMSEYAFTSGMVRSLTASQVAAYPTTGTLGHLTRDSSNNIWLVHSGGKRQLISPTLAASGRFDITVGSLMKLSSRVYQKSSNIGPVKNLLGDISNGRKYYVENGDKRWITSPGAMTGLGYSNADVSTVSSSFASSLPSGANIN